VARILAGFVTLGGERHQKAQRISAEKTQKMHRGEKAWEKFHGETRHGEKGDGEMSLGDKSRRGQSWRKKADPVLALMCLYFPCLQRSTFRLP